MSERARPTPEQLRRYAEQFNQSRSLKLFGVRVAFPSLESAEVSLEVRPEHRGGLGSDAVNGGVLAAMFDLAIGCAPALVDPTRRTATVQLSMSFMRPVRGDRLRIISRVDSATPSTVFATAVLYDASGVECARCQGVARMSRAPWATGESPAVN